MSELLEIIKIEDSLNIIENRPDNITKEIPVYILSQSSLVHYPNIDIKQLIYNKIPDQQKSSIKQQKIYINYNWDGVLNKKGNNEEIYIANKSFLKNIGFNEHNLQESFVRLLINDKNQKFLYFQDGITLSITKINKQNEIFSKNKGINTNNNNIILNIILQLYINEKEIEKLWFSVSYDNNIIQKDYYLVSKDWIDRFKSMYNYKQAYNKLENINQIYPIEQNNFQNYLSNNELKDLYPNEIGLDSSFVQQKITININKFPIQLNNGMKYNLPKKFEIISEPLFNYLKKLKKIPDTTNTDGYKYRVIFGTSNLYIRDNNNNSINLVYYYDNEKKSYILYAILDIQEQYFSSQYQYLKTNSFQQYLSTKTIDFNKINIPQNLMNNKQILGTIILTKKTNNNLIRNKLNPLDNNMDDINNITNINNIDNTNNIDNINNIGNINNIDNINNINNFYNTDNINNNNSKENILKTLINLNKYEKEKINLINRNNTTQFMEFYLINNSWLESYKKFTNYDILKSQIDNNGNKNDLLALIENTQLNNANEFKNNIKPQINQLNFKNLKITFPINFEIMKKDLFEQILDQIDSSLLYNFETHKIRFFNKQILIKFTKDIFIFCSINDSYQYNIKYILVTSNNFLEQCIKEILQIYQGNLEQYFINKLKLNLSQLNIPQTITNKSNEKIIGYFLSLFPYDKGFEIPHDPVPIPPIDPPIPTNEGKHCLGLENIGATCYMNATLQCLCHVISLKNYFLNEKRVENDLLNKNAQLTRCFCQLINTLWKNSELQYFAPHDFKNLISEMNPLFKGIQANDSKDLIIFLYETLHNELNNPDPNDKRLIDLNNPNIDQELKIFRNNYYTQNSSIINKIFYYEQSSLLKCCSCNIKKISYNIQNFIIFPLEKIRLGLIKKKPQGFMYVTLEDCFVENEEAELLFGPNQIYCNNCKRQSNAYSSNKLYNCPEVLTIILNRGKGLEFQVEFKYPFQLDIRRFVTDQNCDTNYELIGVLTHLGPSGMSGHFIAYCKSPNDKKWYCYNDADVKEVAEHEIEYKINENGIPYVLYYQKFKTLNLDENKIEEKASESMQIKDNNNIFNNIGGYKNNVDDQYGEKKNNINYVDNNKIVLYFTYEGKGGYLELEGDKYFYEIMIEIKNKYQFIPQEANNFYLMKNNNMENIDPFKTIKENGLENEDKICIIK